MRKPLIIIIVTLSVVCTLKGMLRWSTQKIKAMLLCIEYGILFVSTVSTYTVKTFRMAPYLIACSMQHVSTVSTYPGSCKTCFSRILVFGGNFLLIFPVIYQIAHLHNWPTWPDYPFDLCWHQPWMEFPACMYQQCQHTPDFQSIWPVHS